MTNCSTSSATRGLPSCRRCVLPSNFCAISRLYQRRSVSGVAMVADVLEALAPERVCERGKAALGISQTQPAATELGFEHAIFLLKVGDDRLIGTTQTG
jgi:hypothetical protein